MWSALTCRTVRTASPPVLAAELVLLDGGCSVPDLVVVVHTPRRLLLAVRLLGEQRIEQLLLGDGVHLQPGVQGLPRGGELLTGQVPERRELPSENLVLGQNQGGDLEVGHAERLPVPRVR